MTLYDDVRRLVDLVDEAAISELTIENDGRRITIKKPSVSPASTVQDRGAHELVPVQTPEAEVAPETGRRRTAAIAAPMVGVFHHAEPPVGRGTYVAAGQVVGVIESMKLMNDVRAEQDGTVLDVLAEAGLAVEYGQPLFELDVEESVLGI